MNVLVVDWGQGAATLNYLQAVANTRLVAMITTRLLTRLEELGAQMSKFHLIGHSLGAHVAGYIGSQVQHIARITGKFKSGC